MSRLRRRAAEDGFTHGPRQEGATRAQLHRCAGSGGGGSRCWLRDAGFAKKARLWANKLRAPTAIADKRRADHTESAEIVELMGSVDGRTALIVDDFTISAGTLIDAARVVAQRGATAVYAAVTHGLLAGGASQRLHDSPIEGLFITDSVETQPCELRPKVEVVSVAGLFAEAIRRIARRESISVLFE